MFRILDRYVLRELTTPFALALLLLTFALEIPPILQHGETLIAEGASWDIVVRVLATLLPQALGITIPMALLVGILFALGRLSGDREIVAMEACGISLGRLLRPLVLFAVVATAATTYVMIVALPAANQAFREITFKLLMARGESKIKPRVFYDGFPNLVIYVREVTPGVGWSDVVVADTSQPTRPQVIPRKEGPAASTKQALRARSFSKTGTQHIVNVREPEKYGLATFDGHVAFNRSRERVPTAGPDEGLHGDDDRRAQEGDGRASKAQNIYPHNQIMAWQKKYSIPAACLAFMLVALGLGVTNKREGNLASFVARHRCRLRLLGSDVHVGVDRQGRASAVLVCLGRDVGSEHRRRHLGVDADREEVADA